MSMPVMDGYQMLDEAKKRNLLGGIPIIAITTEDDTVGRSLMTDLGISEVITKPFIPDIILTRVAHLTELYR